MAYAAQGKIYLFDTIIKNIVILYFYCKIIENRIRIKEKKNCFAGLGRDKKLFF